MVLEIYLKSLRSDVFIALARQSAFTNALIFYWLHVFSQCASFTLHSQGDSGGPMIQYNAAGDPVLVGIVSTGLGCAQAGFPGIYIRTAAFEQWLDGDAAAQYSKTNSTSPIFAPLLSRTIIIAIGVTAGVILIGIIVLIVFLLRMWTSRNR